MIRKVNGRTKGHNFERVVANQINDYVYNNSTYPDVDKPLMRRVPLSGGFDKHVFSGDIMTLHEEIRKEFCLSIECKNYKQFDLSCIIDPEMNSKFIEWSAQNIEDALISKTFKIPVLIIKSNNINKVTVSFIPLGSLQDDKLNTLTANYDYYCNFNSGMKLNFNTCSKILNTVRTSIKNKDIATKVGNYDIYINYDITPVEEFMLKTVKRIIK